MEVETGLMVYCPHCEQVHEHAMVGNIGSTQADGCDVDFPTWKCSSCGREWSGEGYDEAPVTADVRL